MSFSEFQEIVRQTSKTWDSSSQPSNLRGEASCDSEATTQVVDCRRILKWTYAFGFYNFDESIKSDFSKAVLKQQQEFFEFNQVSTTECLTSILSVHLQLTGRHSKSASASMSFFQWAQPRGVSNATFP